MFLFDSDDKFLSADDTVTGIVLMQTLVGSNYSPTLEEHIGLLLVVQFVFLLHISTYGNETVRWPASEQSTEWPAEMDVVAHAH